MCVTECKEEVTWKWTFQRSDEFRKRQKNKVEPSGDCRGKALRGGSILCYSSSQNSLSPAESQRYFKPLRVRGTPLLIEMTVLKVP